MNSPGILGLDALSDSDKIFFTEAMILWLYEFRKTEGKREKFKHALVIEEGHHILSHEKESVEGVETIAFTSSIKHGGKKMTRSEKNLRQLPALPVYL